MRSIASVLERFRPDPFILGLVGALVLGTFIPARGDAALVAKTGANLGIVALFFFHGAKLSRSAVLAGASHWRLHLAVLSTTFVVFPLLGLAIALLASPALSWSIVAGLLFLTLLPSTVQSSVALTAIAHGNVPAAVCSASISNLLGIVLTPVLVWLSMSSIGNGITWNSIETILLQLLAPFVLGHAMQPLIGDWVTKHSHFTSVLDRSSILLVVYSAFSAATVAGLWDRVSFDELILIAAICSGLLAIILGLIMWGARRLGFSQADEVVLAFCGSQKSLVSGVPIANAMFPAAAAGAIILPLMIYHQIQLTVCAALARRYSDRAGLIAQPREMPT